MPKWSVSKKLYHYRSKEFPPLWKNKRERETSGKNTNIVHHNRDIIKSRKKRVFLRHQNAVLQQSPEEERDPLERKGKKNLHTTSSPIRHRIFLRSTFLENWLRFPTKEENATTAKNLYPIGAGGEFEWHLNHPGGRGGEPRDEVLTSGKKIRDNQREKNVDCIFPNHFLSREKKQANFFEFRCTLFAGARLRCIRFVTNARQSFGNRDTKKDFTMVGWAQYCISQLPVAWWQFFFFPFLTHATWTHVNFPQSTQAKNIEKNYQKKMLGNELSISSFFSPNHFPNKKRGSSSQKRKGGTCSLVFRK